MKKTSEIIPRVNVKQSITFNPTQSHSLSILQMNSMQLLHHLKKSWLKILIFNTAPIMK